MSPRVRRLLGPGVCLVALLVVLGLPDLGPAPTGPAPVAAYHARLVALLGEHRTDPANPDPGSCLMRAYSCSRVRGLAKRRTRIFRHRAEPRSSPSYAVGDDVLVTITDAPSGPPFLAISDRWRLAELGILFALFVAAVVLVGGWQGVRALLGLALTAAIVVRVLVPGLLQGIPPVPLAVGLAILLTIAVIGLTEGLSRPGVAAILGTTAALCLTALLSAAAVAFAGFTNAADSELIYLQTEGGAGLDLRGLLLAAFVLGSLGVLNDVTVTQAVAVEQLRDEAGLSGRALYASAFRVGRSHLGASINTLFLAYVGASLPLVVLFSVTQQPPGLILNGEGVATELVRTFVGSIGLVAAVPLSTAFATWLAGSAAQDPAQDQGSGRGATPLARLAMRPGAALVAGLAAIVAIDNGLRPGDGTGDHLAAAGARDCRRGGRSRRQARRCPRSLGHHRPSGSPQPASLPRVPFRRDRLCRSSPFTTSSTSRPWAASRRRSRLQRSR